ncbi:MAG: metallophosphoesterase [Zavarzinella sp.]
METNKTPLPSIVRATARLLGKWSARFHYARTVEPFWIDTVRLEMPVANLPPELDGTKIVQLSDFHCGEHLPDAHLKSVIQAVEQESPQVLVLTGDYVDHCGSQAKWIRDFFGNFKAPMGTYCVLGNHDFSVHTAAGKRRDPDRPQIIHDALVDVGLTVLRNEVAWLGEPGNGLAIAGLDDLWSQECDVDLALGGIGPEVPRLLLAHNPLTVEQLSSHRCDVMFSGHTHGGQVLLEKWGRIFIGKRSRHLAAGLCYHNDVPVYVNRGIGFGWQFRYRVRPEITSIVLRTKNPA